MKFRQHESGHIKLSNSFKVLLNYILYTLELCNTYSGHIQHSI